MNRENNVVYKAHIIGGGFAGMIAAIVLAERFGGENVVISERNDRLGKKILSTGNGQCNITNNDVSPLKYHGNNANFVYDVLKAFSKEYLIKFFNDLGVMLVADGDKYYPMSKQASSILDALRFKIASLKVNVNFNAKAIGTNKEKYFVTEFDDGKKVYSQNLIIATGGKSAKHTGSDGSGYPLATSLGHKITELYPSLVQLKCEQSSIKGLKGLKQFCSVKAVKNGKVLAETKGDTLFTDYGVSGNAIFYLSAYLSGKGEKSVVIDLCPSVSEADLLDFLTVKTKRCGYLKIEDLFSGIINKNIAKSVLKNSLNCSFDDDISKVNLPKAVKAVKNLTLKITGDCGFDKSQVTRGGVDVNDVDCKTMRSKLVDGLYFVGEILDVDGDCGGYNLQWAFSSAAAAANSIAGK